MHERRFEGDIAKLRSPERVERLEVERETDLCLEGVTIGSVLDAGMGSGLFSESFFGRGLNVSGMDANPEMLTAARQFVPAGDFRVGSAEEMPYLDDSYDLVFLGLVLHESDEPLKTLQEARRVARQWVGILEWPYKEGVFGPPLADRFNPDNLVDMFQKAGFKRWKLTELSNTVFYSLEK
ncbi:MAG: class I SAM-dependent methyltransferase [Anaerolineales bacterium]|jgi:SAM-dependent methyltransferase